MSDVFISYSRTDQPVAGHFSQGLEREGFSVWWDQALSAGETFDKATENALRDARAVIVLWSRRSVESRWVRSEATQADRFGKLVPVTIEECDRPIAFELTHTIDLTGWSGDRADPRWRAFLASVHKVVGTTAVPTSAGGTTRLAQEIAPAAPNARPIWHSKSAWAALAVVALVVAAVLAWYPRDQRPAAATAEVDRSIAVLPFESFSADADQDHFADGLTEEILNSLARIPDLQVTARTSAFAFKGKAEDLKSVGSALGVAHVLEGSVRRSGDQLRITTQLINTRTGFHLWSQTYDRHHSDIFAIQDDIARSVARALQVTLGVGVGQQPGMTRNVEAYEAWLAARGVNYTGLSSMRQHIELLQQAVALDPEFALPWWGLSEAYSSTLSGTPADAAERRQKADAALARYRRLLPDSPRIHERLAEDAIEAGEIVAAARHYEAAAGASSTLYGGKPLPLEIFGQGKTPIGFPDIVGRPRESIALFEQEKARDPLNEVVALWLAYLYSVVGDFPGAFAELERAERLGKDARLTYLAIPIALASGNRQRLTYWLDKRIEYEQSSGGGDLSVRLKPLLDKPDEALAILRPLVREGRTSSGLTAWWLAWFGDPDAALDALRVDFERPGYRYAILWIIWDPGFAGVRKLPGFKQLMRDAGLVDYWHQYGWGDYCKPAAGDDFECR